MNSLLQSIVLLSLLTLGLSVTSFGATPIYDEVAGSVVIEAEHFSVRVDDPVAGTHWHIVPAENGDGHTQDAYFNYRGSGFLELLPNAGLNKGAAGVGTPPYVEYLVNINTPGTYQLYLRWKGMTGADDTLYAQIREIQNPGWYRYALGGNPDNGDFDTTGNFTGNTGWDGYANPNYTGTDGGEVPAVYTNLGSGVFTIRISQREDGAAVDALILQLASLAVPSGTAMAESGPPSSYVVILQQPQDTTATPGTTASFSVQAEGTGALTYQWQQMAPGAGGFADVAGANSSSYTTPATTSGMNGTQYRVVVSNGTKSATSRGATLVTDSVPPRVVRATSSGSPGTILTVEFSEQLDPATAEVAANYTINNGVAVSTATLLSGGTSVRLLTSAQTASTSYTLTVTGVKDLAGNLVAPPGTANFKSAKVVAGKLMVRLYWNISGSDFSWLMVDPKYPNLPDAVTTWDGFGPYNTGVNLGSHYGGEASGYYTAPANGAYKFYIRSLDGSALFLGTNDNPASVRQIASVPFYVGGPPFTDQPGLLSSTPINLEAGKKYAVRALWKAGSNGDCLQVGVLGPNDPDINDATAVVPIPAEFLSMSYDENASLQITRQPTNLTVQTVSPATFTVQYDAYNSVFGTKTSVQWEKAPAGGGTFAPVADATNATYTIPITSAADAGSYRAVLTTGNNQPEFGTLATVTSTAATLTVSGSDTTKPTVTSFLGLVDSAVVGFSEPLDDLSATAVTNYTISGGAAINAATVISGVNEAGRVQLLLTGVTPGRFYTVTIAGVKDPAGNASDRTTRSFTAYHINADFNDGQMPAGMAVVGVANAKTSGGVDNTGFIELTPGEHEVRGSLNIDDVLGGGDCGQFIARFKLFIGRGTPNPADGCSFSIANNLTPNSYGNEDGVGNGLAISIDTYDNGNNEAPAIDVLWGGGLKAHTLVYKPLLVNNRWVDVLVQVDTNGLLTVQHDNVTYYDKLDIGWVPITAPQLNFGGRGGGEHEAHWIDSLTVLYNADLVPPTIGIIRNGAHLDINWSGGILEEATSVLGPWTESAGQTSPQTVDPTGAQRFFRVKP